MSIFDVIQQIKSTVVDDTISWLGVQTSSKKVATCFRTVLQELPGTALFLLRDPRFHVALLHYPVGEKVIWAYFPIHRRRTISKKVVYLRSPTRVLLAINASGVDALTMEDTEKELRHHIGHVLLYLRQPRAPNECGDADREWKEWSQIMNSVAV